MSHQLCPACHQLPLGHKEQFQCATELFDAAAHDAVPLGRRERNLLGDFGRQCRIERQGDSTQVRFPERAQRRFRPSDFAEGRERNAGEAGDPREVRGASSPCLIHRHHFLWPFPRFEESSAAVVLLLSGASHRERAVHQPRETIWVSLNVGSCAAASSPWQWHGPHFAGGVSLGVDPRRNALSQRGMSHPVAFEPGNHRADFDGS